MKTFAIFSAPTGKVLSPDQWKEIGTLRARNPMDAAKRYFSHGFFRRQAECRFTNGESDFIFSTPGKS